MEEDSDSPPPLSLSLPSPPGPAQHAASPATATAKHEDEHNAAADTFSPQGFHPYGAGPGGLATDLVDQQTRGYHVRAHERPPPLYQATMGLATAYKHVTEHKDRRRPRAFSTSETHLYTSDDGTLRLGPHLPLMLARYRFVRLVGQGTFAQIICAEDTFHPRRRHVAIKILNLHYAEIGKREALCLRLVHESPEGAHAAVVRFHAVFDFMGHFCIVMELCLGGSFQNYIRPLTALSPPLQQQQQQHLQQQHLQQQHQQQRVSPSGRGGGSGGFGGVVRGGGGGPTAGAAAAGLGMPQIREAALHLVKALLLLHNHDVIHADLKPENVLLAGSGPGATMASLTGGKTAATAAGAGGGGWGQQVRLTDLGNAIKSREVKLYKEDYEIQTLGYRAPEVLLGGCGGQAFDHQIDMWSLGVLLVELYLGRPLFRAASKVLMLKRIVSVLGPLPARDYVSGKFYTAFFGADHRLRPETFGLRDDPTHAATALIDPRKVHNSFVYDGDGHYRLVCDLLRSRDPDFIGFVCGLLQFDPRVRLSAFQALMHPFLAPCFPFTLLKPFLAPGSVARLEEARRPMTSLPPGRSTRVVSSSSSSSSSFSSLSSSFSSSAAASAAASASPPSAFAGGGRGFGQQQVQHMEQQKEEEEEEEEEEEGNGLVAIVESSSSSSSFGRSTKAEEEEEEEKQEATAAAAAAAAAADIPLTRPHSTLTKQEGEHIVALAASSSPPLSPDTTPSLSLEDLSSPPPLPLETPAADNDVILLDEEEEEEGEREEGGEKEKREKEEEGPKKKEKEKRNGVDKAGAVQTKTTRKPAPATTPSSVVATPPPSSPFSKKRPRGSTGGGDSGGSSSGGSGGGGGKGSGRKGAGAGGGGGSAIKKKEEGKLFGSACKKGMTPIKGSSSMGQTPVRKWYEEVAADEDEDEEEEEEARPTPASVGKRKASARQPPLLPQTSFQQQEEEDGDSAGEDELIL